MGTSFYDSDDFAQQTLFVSRGVWVFSLVLASIAVLWPILCAVFVVCQRNNPIVSVGQPFFLVLLCFGAMLCGISAFTLDLDATPFAEAQLLSEDDSCLATLWLSFLGIILMYLSLFCKLHRAYKVTKFRKGQRILARHVIWPLVISLAIMAGLLTSWTVSDPPTYELGCFDCPVDDWKDYIKNGGGALAGKEDPTLDRNLQEEERIYGYCSWNPDYKMILNTLVMVTLFLAIGMAWKTRKVREDVSDSRRIFQVLCFHVILVILSIVQTFANNHNYTWFVLTPILVQFFLATSVTTILIVPKMYYLWYQEKHGRLPDGLRSRSGNIKVSGVTEPTAADSSFPDVSSEVSSCNENTENPSECNEV